MTSAISRQLRAVNLRSTPGRIAVLSVLQAAAAPLDVETIKTKLKAVGTKVNPVTVYRILEQLVEKQLVKRIDFMEGKFRYELWDHHHHVVCRECQHITPVKECDLASLQQTIEDKYQVKIDQHQLEFYGRCSRCS